MNQIQNGLPRGWVATTLGDVIQPSRRKENPKSYPNLPFIGMEHIEAHSMRLLGTVPANTMKSAAAHFFPNDVLYGRLRPYLNKVFRPDFEGLCSSEFIVFPASKHLNARFLQYLLNSIDFVSFASHLNEGDRPRVDFSQISSHEFWLPPLNEQDRLVSKIEELLTLVEAGIHSLRTAQEQLNRYRQSVLNAAISGHLTKGWREVHQDELDPASELLERILKERQSRWESTELMKTNKGKVGENYEAKKKYPQPYVPDVKTLPQLPDQWVWATIDQITELVTKGSSPNWQGFKYTTKGIIFVRSQNVGWGKLDLTDQAFLSPAFNHKEKKSILKSDDILLNIVGASIGRTAVASKVVEGGNVNQAVAVIRLIKPGLAPNLLSCFLMSSDSQKRIDVEKVDVARANLSLNDIKNLPVPLMCPLEQDAIRTELERLLSIAEASQKALDLDLRQAERLRQSIVKQAFEGKLVPQDNKDEPAELLLERIKTDRLKQDADRQRSVKSKPSLKRRSKRMERPIA